MRTLIVMTVVLFIAGPRLALAADPVELTNDQSPTVTAAPLDDVSFRVVSYRDLDLSNQADSKILASRIRRAVEIVCESHNSKNIARIRECRDLALTDAKRQVLEQSAVSLAAAD
jgi:UrcA family protein